MKIKISAILAAIGSLLMVTGCYEDKGNYSYNELDEIEVTFPASIECMQGDMMSFSPKVVSSLHGEIKADNPTYEYTCRINHAYYDENRIRVLWTDVNPEHTKDISFTASYPAQNYTFWYIVKNKETGVERNFRGTLNIKSATSEGWMVLSNNGPAKKSRLDIIYTNAEGKDMLYADIKDANSPEIYNATGIVYLPSKMTGGDIIYLLSESGSYKLDKNRLVTTASENIKNYEFSSLETPGEVVTFFPILAGGYSATTKLCVTTEGDAYGVHSGSAGSGFEYPMNSDAPGNPATYKVAPMIGSSMKPTSWCGLFYDITNGRFMGSYYTYQWGVDTPVESKLLFTLLEPEQPIFTFNPGMKFIDMESTAFSDGDVFTVLEDNSGKRHVYVINMAGYTRAGSFKQKAYYNNINAENFHTATDYAVHSQYVFMFYCLGNKVYCYDYVSGIVKDVITLPNGENASLVKFNSLNNLRLSSMLYDINNTSEEFLNLENELIVGSSTGEENGGVVRIYKISPQGKMELHKEFKGLGEEIVDVTYRERQTNPL